MSAPRRSPTTHVGDIASDIEDDVCMTHIDIEMMTDADAELVRNACLTIARVAVMTEERRKQLIRTDEMRAAGEI